MTDNLTLDGPRDDLEALLPWYLNGTVNADERRAIDAWLAEDAQARQLLQAMREEREIVDEDSDAIVVPDAKAGLAALMAAIDAETPAARRESAPRQAVQARPGLLARMAAWLPTPGHRLAAGLAGVLVIAQAAALAVVLSSGGGEGGGAEPGFRVASGGEAAATGPRFIVMFPETMTMADVDAYLSAQQMLIVDGPRGGMYQIAPASGEADEAALAAAEENLRSDPQVQFIGRAE
ncbi:MAG: hypothetical protein R3F55_16575 [Alphaproteobacteria bacterium]